MIGTGTLVAAEPPSPDRATHLLAAIVESSDDAIVSKDLDGVILSWNKGAERVFGYRAEEAIGKSITIVIPEDRHHEEAEILARIRQGLRIGNYRTVRRRKDGTLIDISLTVSPVKDAEGRIVGASKIARDITWQKRAEAQRELLVAELNHRVKNTLAIVQGIAHQTFRGTDVPPDVLKAFEGRLMMLAAAHSLLTQANWEWASLDRLIVDALRASAADEQRFSLAGPRVLLPAKPALAIAMALHELSANALKYGALSNPSGQVAVSWSTTEGPEPRLEFVWQEHGGPPVPPPRRRGFGSRLIEQALAQDLGGEVDLQYRPEGLVCTVRTPLPGTGGGAT